MKIKSFRRRSEGQPFAALLENYLVRAEAIAAAGGGELWVVEPSLPPDLVPDVTEAVRRHLADHGVSTDGVTVLDDTASARIAVSERLAEVVLARDELTLPESRTPEAHSSLRMR